MISGNMSAWKALNPYPLPPQRRHPAVFQWDHRKKKTWVRPHDIRVKTENNTPSVAVPNADVEIAPRLDVDSLQLQVSGVVNGKVEDFRSHAKIQGFSED